MKPPSLVRFTIGVFGLTALTFCMAPYEALAYPEGAPWGAANPAAAESCGSCHYDYEPITDSASIRLDGLPARVEPESAYAFILRFADDQASVAGFQLLVSSEDSQQRAVGRFITDSADIEVIGAAARSTATRGAEQGVGWHITWQTPPDAVGDLVLYVAASAANDDQSPFGDTIHYRRYPLTVQLAADQQSPSRAKEQTEERIEDDKSRTENDQST